MARTITSANAIITLTIPGIFSAPKTLQQFSVDDIFGTDPLQLVEVQMGVDGIQSQGFVNVSTKQNYSLMANSPSCDIFDDWANAMRTAIEAYSALGTITLTSIGKKYNLTDGALTSYPPMADGGRTLKPRKFEITWGQVLPVALV